MQQQVDAIKVLISNNDLTGALEKAKELKRTTTASTQQTMEIKKTVDQVNTATLAHPAIGNTTTTISLPPSATGTAPVSGT
ncbi:MAG: hypothetical protein UY72_C0075G0003 [Candidatus Uhrbacteria bacterium GW2011_GWD2_52_7]|uniref:Uncharacterized protein n=1 Tax=Candidatus Uhrbacteria bacterium GW2011_GWD2_52_7 TaxID=1618989 RepID=A0A0G2A7Q1_9BACT|nr:MAG: hypothetical protein UY72_C0075G0003 [Candidatus Uhrbacteria bacterium GW2011_GWD2_52_7]